jgi:ABC-2 type transport system permease protein
MKTLLLFLRKDLKEIRSNKQVWPVYLILPPIGLALPVIFVAFVPAALKLELEKGDAVSKAILGLIHSTHEFSGMSTEEALARFLLRNLTAFFLLMPLGIASISAAFSVVGEKQQRTLEPLLATPISDEKFMLGKMLAAAGPAILITWVTAALTLPIVDVITLKMYGSAILPDRFWVVAIFVLAPLVAVSAVLATMRVSARMTDPQAANQFAGMVVLPVFLLALGIFGKLISLSFLALSIACAVVFLVAFYLYRLNLRKFQREEILTRWK